MADLLKLFVLGKRVYLKMDGFLEANRVMEVSLTKLNGIHKSGDLPLRKTLLISKVLNKAQDVATSAHFSILRSSSVSTTSSSKLLASISQDRSDSEETLPTGPARPARGLSRQQSPIASAALASSKYDDESMDFENVSSVLSDILDIEMAPTAISCEEPIQEATIFANDVLASQDGGRAAKRSKLLDVSNTTEVSNWSSSTWQFELNSELRSCWQWNSEQEERSLTASPGKREHKVAFPFDQENSIFWDSGLEEVKRFKPSPPEGCPLESLPGFCGYLSPKNLQSAPLITYMFGKGFADPDSSSQQCDWPELSLVGSNGATDTENHLVTPSLQTSPIKFNPIMAF